MKFILFILKIVFFPARIVTNLIYDNSPLIVGYSWYTKNNYNKMVKNAKDENEEGTELRSYGQWTEFAKERISYLKEKNYRVFRVYIDYDKMSDWLQENSFDNIKENRELYVEHLLKTFMQDPIIK